MSKRWSARLAGGFVAMSTAVALAACGTPGASSPGAPAASEGGSARPVARPQGRPRLLEVRPARRPTARSTPGVLTVGLDYATKGTGAVNGRTIEVTEADDAGDPAKAVTAGDRPHRRRATRSSPARRPRASRCRSRRWPRTTRCCSSPGPAATDAVTGANKYTFRSGRQTYQDVATAGIDARRPHGQEGHRASRRTAPSARPTSPPSRRSSAPRARPSTPSWCRPPRPT